MATLVSPGVSVSVIDESFYVGAGQGTVPMIFITTRENKPTPDGSGVAPGTLKENANKLYLISSQRELIQTFGLPEFEQVGGAQQNGNVLNEYGLLAAHSYLGLANRAYVMRADVDLAQLRPLNDPPESDPIDLTYWTRLSSLQTGLFRSENGGLWEPLDVKIYTGTVTPGVTSASGFVLGDTVLEVNQSGGFQLWERAVNFNGIVDWVPVGVDYIGPHTDVPPFSGSGETRLWFKTTNPNQGAEIDVLVFDAEIGRFVDAGFVRIASDSAEYYSRFFGGDATAVPAGSLAAFYGERGEIFTSQDESNFDGTVAGTGYLVSEQLTMSNGLVIRVDAVGGSGDVTEFTVIDNSAATPGEPGDTLTVASGSPGGSGFEVTLAERNYQLSYELKWHNGADSTQAVSRNLADVTVTGLGDVVINGVSLPLRTTQLEQTVVPAAPSGNTYAPGDTITLSNGDTIQVDAVDGVVGAVTEYTVVDGSGLVANTQVLTQTATSGSGTGFSITLDNTLLDLANVRFDLFVDDVNDAGIGGISATLSGNQITIVDAEGDNIQIEYANLAFLTDAELFAATSYSNFILIGDAAPAYRASFDEPTTGPRDGVLWYDPGFEVDLLVRGTGVNSNSWVTPQQNGEEVFITPVEPTERLDGSSLADGDVWINTLFTEEYPAVFRYRAGILNRWIRVDTTDQTTPDGILFADARPGPGYISDNSPGTPQGEFNGDVPGNPDLDPDVPDPLLYPADMLLWNTRYSSRNVKQWVQDYEVEGEFLGGRWVSVSGTALDGRLLAGEDAVRRAVSQQIAGTVVNNDEIRAESIFYNLITAPGFPELADELVALNIDRRETAFILGDTPMDLTPDSTSLQEYAQNIEVNSENIAFYYPGAALTTNLDGQEVVVPSSHITLRTFAFNDLVAYPWFAPAGFQRGRVNNATQSGFINFEGEFVPVTLNQGQRDVLYVNNVNPIVFAPNRGLTVFGQKTRYPLDSALDRVNVARLINFIRFQAERIAEPFLFEPNDTQTRIAVKDRFDSFLDELVTLRGLFDFLVVCDESNNTPARIDRNELWVDIAISPTKAVEFIYIPIRVRNTGADLTI